MTEIGNQGYLSNEKNVELWLRMYEEEMRYRRHHEVLRFHSTSVIVAISAALIAYLASQGTLGTQPFVVGVFLIVANILGVAISLKHYERSRRHAAFSEAYRSKISLATYTPNTQFPSLEDVRKAAEKCHCRRTSWLSRRLRVYILWCFIHGLLIVIGLSVFVDNSIFSCWSKCFTSAAFFLL